MATYIDLYNLSSSGTIEDLRKKLLIAMTVKAHSIAASPAPTAAARAWAKSALENPQAQETLILNYVLAANNTASTTVIAAASDSTVQTAVNQAVDTLLGL